MPADHLAANPGAYIIKIKMALLRLHLAVQRNLKQHISQLLPQKCGTFQINGFYSLIRLLQEIIADGVMILRPIPRASFRAPQNSNNLN